MSNRNEQNGRQPPQPRQTVQSQSQSNTDSHNENMRSNDKKEICKDFVWGKCQKGAKCKFKHELDFEAMKRILKFCHDHQNPTGCIRENCTYLHASKEEENLFLTSGQLPPVLAERHMNMSATVAETIPQIALYIQESLIAGPPPPPPPPSAQLALAPTPPAPAPTYHHRPVMPLQQMQQPPPPPPPIVQPNSLYTAPPPINMAIPSTSSARPVFPRFDASVPPPPIPTSNGAVKRKPPDFDAPSAKRKAAEAIVADANCDQCVLRENRIEEIRKEIERLQRDDEFKSLILRRKLEEFESRKEELKQHVSPQLFSCIVEYIENPQANLHRNLHDSYVPFSNSLSMDRKQFLLQIINFILNGENQNHIESSNAASSIAQRDDTLLQSLLVQKSLPQNAQGLQKLLMEILLTSNAADRGHINDLSGDILRNGIENGYHRAQGAETSTGRVSQAQAQVQAQAFHVYHPPPAAPAPSPTTAAAAAAAPAPPPAAPAPAPAPAPANLYYSSPYPALAPIGTGVANTNQMGIARVPPPPTSVPAPMPSYLPYQLGNYPPPFYQRHQ